MKKWVIAAALTGVAWGAFAQGTVFFDNNSLSLPAVDYTYGTLASAGHFKVALYWLNQSSGPFTPINPITATPVVITTGNSAGGFNFGNSVTIIGQTAGGNGEFVVAAWWGTQYSTFAAATVAGAPTDYSQPFYNATGGNGTPPAIAQELTGWTGQRDLILVTPEPSTIALGGLGAAALLLFRRRR